jgi:hypothetical protein
MVRCAAVVAATASMCAWSASALSQPAEAIARCQAVTVPQFRAACFEAIKPKAAPKPRAPAQAKAAPAPVAPVVPAPQTFDRMRTDPGQPLCINEDSLFAYLASSILAVGGKISDDQISTDGCQAIPTGATAEVLERYASGASGMRIVKVKVFSQKLRGPTVGYTIEIDK